MKALGRTLFVFHIIFLLLAALLIGGSFGGFTGSGYNIAGALVAIVLWGLFAVLAIISIRHAARLATGGGDLDLALNRAYWVFLAVWIVSMLTGCALVFLAFTGCGPLWLFPLYHFAGLVGAVLGLTLFFIYPWIVRVTVGRSGEGDYGAKRPWWKILVVTGSMAILWGLVVLVPYFLLSGSVTVAGAERKYKLPFPKGESTWVIQGNNSSLNHNDSHNKQKYSWDFRRHCGTPVLAARDGTIQSIVDTNDGMDGKNNQIAIDHGNGIVSYYLHIEKGSGKYFKKDDPVKQGQQIARVGSVGNSMTGHIHFMVRNGTDTMAVSFIDVTDDSGIPRGWSFYTSGNPIVPK